MINNTIRPTAAELEILQVLWKYKSATVRFVHDKINQRKNVGYTTTLKIMQNMATKKIVRREQNERSHVYIPLLKKQQTQGLLLDKFLDSAFGGSASTLVMQVLGNHRTSEEELDQIKKLIQKLEEKK
ncbi:MAG TPA: BlaI/MecI/CopY family transcriptional regulator [Bacteroidales bacterium]|nr:BlaI/MecI/CopY family transcriptional regulator [Bacteroidales bacterium]